MASLLDTARTGGSTKKWLTESALNSQFINAFERGQKKAFEGQFTPEELEMLSDLADERGISIQEVLKSGDIGDAGDYTGGWDEDIFREGFKGPSQSAVQSNIEMFEAMSPTERAKNPTMQQIFGDRYGDLPGQFEDYKSTWDSLGSAEGLSALMSGASKYMTDNQQVMLALLELDQQMKRDKSPFKYRGGGDRIMPRSSDPGYTPRARGAQGSSTAQYADGGKIPSYLTGGEVQAMYAAYKLAKEGYNMYKGLKGGGDGPDAPSGGGDGGMDNWEKARAAAEIGKDLYSVYDGFFGDKDDGSGMYGMGMQQESESLANTQATLDSMLNERQGYSDLITQKSHVGVIPDYENGGSIKLMDMSELDEFNKFHSKEEDLERIIKNFSRQGFADPIRPMAYGGLIPGYENGGENGDEHDEPEDYYRPPTPDDKADAYAKAKAASEAREAARRKARGEPERPDDWDSMSFDQKQAWFNQNESTPEEELARKKQKQRLVKKQRLEKKQSMKHSNKQIETQKRRDQKRREREQKQKGHV